MKLIGWRFRSRVLALSAAAFVIRLAAGQAAAAQPGTVRTLDEVQRALPAAATQRDLQIRLRWVTADAVIDPANTINRFELLSLAAVAPAAAPRRPRFHANSIVVITEDTDGRALALRAITDPRAVRSESQAGAQVTGETLFYVDSELLVTVPDVAGTARIRLFTPRRTDAGVVLEAIGAVDLR